MAKTLGQGGQDEPKAEADSHLEIKSQIEARNNNMATALVHKV